IEAVEAAQEHVHVQFYIIQPDRTGFALRDRLIRRANDGIKIRVLCDGLGSGRLPSDFWQPLVDAGGEAAVFHPVFRWIVPFRRRDRVDFRNHRKIVVVDGKVGFTGGINIGNEYLGLDPDMGQWRDTHLSIEGPAVLGLQTAFVEDWMAATGRVVEDDGCFPVPDTSGTSVVQIVDSGPDRTWSPIAHVFMQAYATARDRIWITSPYFVPSPEIYETLITAALRGVDVRLLLPVRADSLLVHLAAHSYYRRLLDAGVRIYHYESMGWRWRRRRQPARKGFIHAKTLVVDDWVGTIGSSNMDMRSFKPNFELNAFVLDRAFVQALATQFRADLQDAREFTSAELAQAGIPKRLMWQTARLLSPLL
ncbi:MAG: cardiolipin synthase, partial [Planctomycetes bacterium]|nr:cardiolipin synthase [Planctomycetota bacterium]